MTTSRSGLLISLPRTGERRTSKESGHTRSSRCWRSTSTAPAATSKPSSVPRHWSGAWPKPPTQRHSRTVRKPMQLTVEAWTSTVAQLTPEQAQAIAEVGLAAVQIDQPPDSWKLVTDSRVGVLDHGDWGLRVVPRLAVPKVMFLLGYAADPRGWRSSIAMFGRERDFFSAIASGFAHHAYRALEPAPLRGYVTVDEQ